jgi:alkylation response protein AidB-like acyl-CoA dehydrogenase
MIDFEPSEEQKLIQQSVAQFAKATLAPRIRAFEEARAVPAEVREHAHELGLAAAPFPEALGGSGLGLLTSVLIEEELGYADAAAAFGLAGPHAFGHAVVELGDEATARAALAPFFAEDGHRRFGAVAWSEPAPNRERAGFTTTAEEHPDGFRLQGSKAFVHNAELASEWLVFAQVDPTVGWKGIGAFLVPRESPGAKVVERHRTLGLDAASFGRLELEGVIVPASARLLGPDGDVVRGALRFFAKHALVVAARAVGVARYAFEMALEHCQNRKAFGKPIGHFQAVAFNLADRLIDVDSARWLVWRGARAWDAGAKESHALKVSAQGAAHALEAVMRTADDCVALHGGSGFIRDLAAEKLMRDAKQLGLCCPTAEQLDQLAAAVDLGIPLDPALVLPTPDTQAIFT